MFVTRQWYLECVYVSQFPSMPHAYAGEVRIEHAMERMACDSG